MEDSNQEENNNQNHIYANQKLYEEGISYPEQMQMESNELQQEEQANQNDYAQQQENAEQMPPIYAKEIESIKETTEHQIKYFEPIEISSEEDVAKYLQGKLMSQIAPKIQVLKQETEQQGMSNDPNVRTQITYALKQNDAIYNNPQSEGKDEEEQERPSQNEQLNSTSPYMNNKLSIGLQGNYDMSKIQQFRQGGQMQNNNLAYNQQIQQVPGGIKYSSILPPKYAQTKIILIDQYGNRHEEEQNEEDGEGPMDNDEIQKGADRGNMQQRQELEEQQLKQQQMQQQYQQLQLLKQQQQLLKQQLLQHQQLQQQRLEQQRLEQMKIQQQQMDQQKIKQQQLLQQQQLQQQKLPKQSFQELQRMQQQSINSQYRPSQPNQTSYPYSRAYSDNKQNNYQQINPIATQRIPIDRQPFQIHHLSSKSPNKNLIRNNINMPRKDPVVQKVYKISEKTNEDFYPLKAGDHLINSNLPYKKQKS